jgi:ketosteroid isomerase-like protein
MSSTPEAAVAAYFNALNCSDAEALTSLFDEEGVFIGEGAPTASGRAQIRVLAEGAFGAMRVDHDHQVGRIKQRDRHAVVPIAHYMYNSAGNGQGA